MAHVLMEHYLPQQTRDVVAAILLADDPATSETYRQKAARLRAVAKGAENAALNGQLMELARQFEEFAENFRAAVSSGKTAA